ncbi:MAG: aldo/keto reductase family oxidoreductase [Bacillus sp. (in: firmicutes)]
MEYITLNESVSLSRIIQGFWRLTEWNMSTDELIAFIEACIEKGVTTFDTAEIYGLGECEVEIGKALKKAPYLRKKMQIVTKTGITVETINGEQMGYYDTRYERIVSSCQKSIENLQCDYIDLFLIHREDPCINHAEVARALNDLLQQGLIKSAGVSNFDPFKFEALQSTMNQRLVTNQIEVNPTCFEHFNSGMMDVLGKHQISPMIWSPLAGGKLFTSEEEIYVKARTKIEEIAKRHGVESDTIVYAWLMYHPVKAMPISGSRKLERLENAIKAFEVKLAHHEWYEIYIASGQQILR